VAGHNVRFDLDMLAGHGARIGVPMGLPLAYDTLPLARRLVRQSPDFRLGTLIRTLGIEFKATHRALDDVLATVALAQKLVALAREHAPERRSLVATMAPRLLRLRQTLDRWAAELLRPAELLARIVDEALRKKYPRQPERVEALGTLVAAVPPLDDPALPPRRALRHVLDRIALLRDLDSLDADLEVVAGVRIMTVHQAKGLEFDEVHVAGLVDGVFPLSSASGDPEQREEERRLLYVAMTRARERLHLTYWKRDVEGEAVRPSPLLAGLLDP
jgi:DNA helicase-2/ATP-dependent DNA helicase PcrA